jgi:hypothetical protein
MLGVRGHGPDKDVGAVVFFEIASIRPLRLTFQFTPDVMRMWPTPNFGRPGVQWLPAGYNVLHTDNPELSAAVGMPGTEPGIMPLYQ